MSQSELLKKVVAVLDAAHVPYMLTGSYASSIQGEPRLTHDIDFVVSLDQAGARWLLAAFRPPDYYLDEHAISEAIAQRSQFNLLDAAGGDKVDFWILTDEPFDKARFAGRYLQHFEGQRLFFSRPEDTILMKLHWAEMSGGSEKQFGDAAQRLRNATRSTRPRIYRTMVRPARRRLTLGAHQARGKPVITRPAKSASRSSVTESFDIHRYEAGGALSPVRDELTIEEPLEIRVQNRAVSVTMRTPGNDEELAAGFLLTEGIIRDRGDLIRIEPCPHDRIGNVVNAILSPATPVDFDRLTRHVFASSSCGLCGKATIEAICQRVEAVESDVTVDADILMDLPERLRQVQSTFNRTGGLHGAAIFTAQGKLIVAREDVGRHNAVDKVLGFGLINNLLPFDRHILMVSGRLSFEIMQKSLAGRIPIVAGVSAPSSLAVEFADESGQTLVGFIRDRRMNVYAGVRRVTFLT